MELEEAISKLKYELDKSKIVKKYQGKPEELFDDLDEYIKSIETVLNQLTKQEKMIDKYEEMIIKHKEQLKKAGIYGYDYDLKILADEESE